MTLPASFFFWAFVPSRGVVKAVCEPTTRDPATAEVASAVLVVDDKRPIRTAYDADTQRRLDEAASDALDGLKCGASPDNEEAASLKRAEAVEEKHLRFRYTHPEDRPLPAWQE